MATTMAPPSVAGATKPKAGITFSDQPVALKVFIAIFAVSVVCAIYYFALHMELAENIERAEREHAGLLQQRSEAVRRQQEFVRLSQELVEREPIDRRNRRILPENSEIPAFLGDVNRLAELSGLGIDLVQPEPESQEQNYVRIPVAMRFHGRFHQFAKFFHAISQLDRAVSMENLVIIPDEARSRAAAPAQPGEVAPVPQIQLRVNLLASTFRRPREGEGAPPRPAARAGGRRR